MVTVLTIAALGGADMRRWCGGWATRQGEVVAVPTAANLSVNAIPDAAAELDNSIYKALATPGEVIVFAHSQGAQVASEWLRRYADADRSRLRFVLTGNPERAYFGYAARKPSWVWGGNLRGLTPDSTGYRVLDIGRESDRWANSPGGLAALWAFLPHAGHLDYSKVNPDEIDPRHVAKTVGLTRYANLP
ncbi:MAG: PE-PPE domain-containing protein [Mycobacterium sp.]